MQSDTQKNWNEYFNNKKQRNFKPLLIIIVLLLAAAASFIYLNPLRLSAGDVKGIFRDLFNAHDPYLDGEMMNTMVVEVDHMESKCLEYVDQLLSYNAEMPDQDFLDSWGDSNVESLKRLDHMHYHPSYAKFIEACRNMLKESEKLLYLITSKNTVDSIGDNAQAASLDLIYAYSDQIDEELMKAFDQNGIEYYEDEDYINYYYK